MFQQKRSNYGGLFPSEDKDSVYAQTLSEKFITSINRIEKTLKAIRKNESISDDNLISNTELIGMVNSFTIRNSIASTDIPKLLIRIINMYIENDINAGNDYDFLTYFLSIITEQYNDYINSLSENMQTRLRAR